MFYHFRPLFSSLILHLIYLLAFNEHPVECGDVEEWREEVEEARDEGEHLRLHRLQLWAE